MTSSSIRDISEITSLYDSPPIPVRNSSLSVVNSSVGMMNSVNSSSNGGTIISSSSPLYTEAEMEIKSEMLRQIGLDNDRTRKEIDEANNVNKELLKRIDILEIEEKVSQFLCYF